MLRILTLICLMAGMQACAGHQVEMIDVEEPPLGKYYNIQGNGAEAMDEYQNDSAAYMSDDSSYDPYMISSDPSVQVFSLDEVGAAGGHFVPSPTPSVQPSYSGNPSVEIFPLDDVLRTEWENPAYVPPIEVLTPAPAAGPLTPTPVPVVSPVGTEPNFVAIETPGEPLVRIYFDHDATGLEPSDLGGIAEVSERFDPSREFSMISVEGYASVESSEPDPIKRRIVNMRVSMDRVYAVARALMEAGVPAEQIRTVAWGEDQTISSAEQARRVDVFKMPHR